MIDSRTYVGLTLLLALSGWCEVAQAECGDWLAATSVVAGSDAAYRVVMHLAPRLHRTHSRDADAPALPCHGPSCQRRSGALPPLTAVVPSVAASRSVASIVAVVLPPTLDHQDWLDQVASLGGDRQLPSIPWRPPRWGTV